MCVRPSTGLYSRFSLDMGRSPGFGSMTADSLALFRLGFPSAPRHQALNLASRHNSPDRSTESTRSRPCGAPTACRRRVSGSLSLPSRGPFHLSLTVLYAIGHRVVFSLGGWSPRLPTGFLVSRGTPDPARSARLSRTRLSLAVAGFPKTVPLALPPVMAVHNPGRHAARFRLFPFRSPLLRESMFLSLPPAT